MQKMENKEISEYWAIVKNSCIRVINEPVYIGMFLNRGFTVTHVYKEGDITHFKSYSPLTLEQARNRHRRMFGNLAF